MSFLDWDAKLPELPQSVAIMRRAIAARLVRMFSHEFQEISFEVMWNSGSVNAQAWKLDQRRGVALYGGLVRHPDISFPGLALTLAHEAGHHLAGPPYDPLLPWLSSQSQADYWAGHTGMPRVFGNKAIRLTLRGARQIETVCKSLPQREQCGASYRFELFRAGALHQEPPQGVLDVKLPPFT